MRKKNNPMLKSMKKKIRKEKDSSYFQRQPSKRERVMFKGVQKIYLELGRFLKYHTLAHSWSKCMTCISSDPVFDLATLCDASMPLFHTYPKLHQKPLEVGWKERQTSNALVRIFIHIKRLRESFEELIFILQNFSKTSRRKVDQRMNDKHFCEPFYLATT